MVRFNTTNYGTSAFMVGERNDLVVHRLCFMFEAAEPEMASTGIIPHL